MFDILKEHLVLPKYFGVSRQKVFYDSVNEALDFDFGETLKFDLIVTRVGRASLTLRHKISVADQTRWTCTQVLASSDLDSHTAKPWDDTVKSLLETWQIDTDGLPF